MFRYAQINEEGIVVSDSYLSGEVIAKNMIAIAEDFDLNNKKYVDGKWVECTPEPIAQVLTEQEKTALETALNIEYLVCLADMEG
ncbi:MAG: flagellar basal-body rod protein [Lachnospiraceae bacterium]|nr:flagellar basal-body rod protein [Lachnospiraceae bacterium]